MFEEPEWAKRKKNGRPAKYGFEAMQLYEVKTIPPSEVPERGLSSITALLSSIKKRTGLVFKRRQLPDGTVEVCRVK